MVESALGTACSKAALYSVRATMCKVGQGDTGEAVKRGKEISMGILNHLTHVTTQLTHREQAAMLRDTPELTEIWMQNEKDRTHYCTVCYIMACVCVCEYGAHQYPWFWLWLRALTVM